VHNRKDFTRNCLESLAKQSLCDFTIIVVDDGSTDGTSEIIEKVFPDVILLTGNGSLWWTGGVNKGIEEALQRGATHILTMNDDTSVPANFVHEMLKWAQVHPEAIMGALEVDINTRRPLYAGQQLHWPYLKSTKLLETLPEGDHHGLHQIKVFHGRGLWIPAKVFQTIGLFDIRRFPHYLADFDFTANAHRAGFMLYCNFDAVVYSYSEESGEKKIKRTKSLRNFYRHLFSRRGGANLLDYTRFVLKNCPRRYVPVELFLGYSRRVFGFWK